MRKLKTRQQIICVTRDEHILEIFEGDRFALLEKSRKLGRILE